MGAEGLPLQRALQVLIGKWNCEALPEKGWAGDLSYSTEHFAGNTTTSTAWISNSKHCFLL